MCMCMFASVCVFGRTVRVEWVLRRVQGTLVGLGYERRCSTGIAEVVGVRFRVADVDTGVGVCTCLVRVWVWVYKVLVSMRV
jgi:hypothetical protein